MIALRCPHDRLPLEAVRRGALRFFRCPRCEGCAVNLSALRTLTSPDAARAIWRRALDQGSASGPPCPSCERSTQSLPAVDGHPELDVCRSCQVVWFDPGELDEVAEGASPPPPPEKPLPTEALELLARAEAEREAPERHSGPPDDALRAGLAMWGVPFEEGVPERRVTPVVAWGLSGLSVLTFVLTLPSLDETAGVMGFVPEEAWRGAGLPLLSSVLVHEDPVHLALDLMLLLIFADNVEDEMGPGWFLGMVLGATALGGLLHATLDPFPEFALVGSTAAGTAAFVYYGLRFPRARLGAALDMRSRWGRRGWGGWLSPEEHTWVRIPAMAGVGIWIVVLLLLTGAQVDGEGWISGAAGLGGAVVGLAVWLIRGGRRW